MTKVTASDKEIFIDLLAEGQSVGMAASKVGFSRMTLYRHRAKSAKFDREWTEAARAGAMVRLESFEQEADRRGVDGYYRETEEIAADGETRLSRRVKLYDGKLLLARIIAEANRAGDTSYRQRGEVEHGGAIGIRHGVLRVPGEITPQQWDDAAQTFAKTGPPPVAADFEDDGEDNFRDDLD